MASYIGFITLIVLFIILIGSYFLLKYFVSPIISLSNFAKKVTSGDYSIRSEINSSDEIGDLSKEFNKMVETIEENINTLEDKVDKKTQENLQKNQLLEEQNKMAAMGEMIGNIAHQWRQPLSMITSSSTGILYYKDENLLTDEMLEKEMNLINENAQYLSRTIDDFKNFIKGERKLEYFNFDKEIQQLLNLILPAAKNNEIQIIQDIDKSISTTGYPNELLQCFINIFNNAKDALKENVLDSDRLFFISVYKDKQSIKIEFKDNGGGVPDTIIDKIFDPYFTTKHQSQGTGLGLHMTYKIITEGMSGSIYVHNETYTYNGIQQTGAKFIIQIKDQTIH
jgi:signal transduction histidine kinase